MAIASDGDFVTQLRGMAADAPALAVPESGTVVRAARGRVARRRSLISGAFGVVLLAGAGFTSLGHTPTTSVDPSPIAPVELVQSVAPLDARIAEEPGETEEAAELSRLDSAAAETGAVSPLTTGLGIVGMGSVAAAAAFAVRGQRLQPVRVGQRSI